MKTRLGGKLAAMGPPFCEPKMGAQIIAPVLDVFRKGKKTVCNLHFTRQGGVCRPIFLCLVTVAFYHYNKPAFEFNRLKTGS
jgi:hypothetical protein